MLKLVSRIIFPISVFFYMYYRVLLVVIGRILQWLVWYIWRSNIDGISGFMATGFDFLKNNFYQIHSLLDRKCKKKGRERHQPVDVQLMKATVLAESSILYLIFSLPSLRYRDVYRCESGRCRSLPFLAFFYHFTFPGFHFILIFTVH